MSPTVEDAECKITVVRMHCPWHVPVCLHPSVRTLHSTGEERKIMMMCVSVDIAPACTCAFYTPVYRTLHSTGGEGEIMVMVRTCVFYSVQNTPFHRGGG